MASFREAPLTNHATASGFTAHTGGGSASVIWRATDDGVDILNHTRLSLTSPPIAGGVALLGPALLGAVSTSGYVHLRDLTTQHSRRFGPLALVSPSTACWTAAGVVAVGQADGSLQVFDTATPGATPFVLKDLTILSRLWTGLVGSSSSSNAASIVALSPLPCSAQLAALSADGTLRIWDLSRRACVCTADGSLLNFGGGLLSSARMLASPAPSWSGPGRFALVVHTRNRISVLDGGPSGEPDRATALRYAHALTPPLAGAEVAAWCVCGPPERAQLWTLWSGSPPLLSRHALEAHARVDRAPSPLTAKVRTARRRRDRRAAFAS